jgi:NADPH2:quinone reductase
MTETIQKTMPAATINRFGGIEEIKLQMLPVSEIEPDEVLIRIESAGVGVWDAFEREGGFAKMFGVEPKFPYVLGSHGAGTVSAGGEQANRFKEGDRALKRLSATEVARPIPTAQCRIQSLAWRASEQLRRRA